MHWAKLNRVRDKVADDVGALLLEAGWRPGKPLERAVVTVQVFIPDWKPRDADNTQAAMKPIFDALKNHGVIKDDDFKCIGFPKYLDPVYRKSKPGTLMQIEERK